MFRFIHAADIHLDSPLRGLESYEDAPLAELRSASRRAFDNLVELAVAEKVDFVLLCGDLFDGEWKDYNSAIYFMERMAFLKKYQVRVFLISGNHDAASRVHKAMQLPGNVDILPVKKPGTIILEQFGVAIHGQGYKARAVTDNLAKDFPAPEPGCFNIGMLHTGLTGRVGHEPYAPCSMDDLTGRGYDYWALGHVHEKEQVCASPMVVFPGCLQGRHIRETGAKGAYLVTVAHGRATIEHRELDVLRWLHCKIDLQECGSLEQVYDLVRQRLQKELDLVNGRTLAVRLDLTGQTSVHGLLFREAERLNDDFRGLAVSLGDLWLEKIRFSTARPGTVVDGFEQDSPLAGLLATLESVSLKSEELHELVPEIAQLKNKLPADIVGSEGIFADHDSEWLEQLSREARELLTARLMGARER